MKKPTLIEWTDFTYNFWIGCSKVSTGCQNCYAERDFANRWKRVNWGENGDRRLTSIGTRAHAYRLDKYAQESRIPQRVFAFSLGDVFEDWDKPILHGNGDPLYICRALHESDEIRDDGRCSQHGCKELARPMSMDDARTMFFDIVDQTPHLYWMVLTKRPQNIHRMLPDNEARADYNAAHGLSTKFRMNLWLGTSAENQETADERLPHLLDTADYSRVRFLICEPLLGQVNLINARKGQLNALVGDRQVGDKRSPTAGKIDYVIAGGESGPNARPTEPSWFHSLRLQCLKHDTPFHFKQWGEHNEAGEHVGKKRAGRMLAGKEHNGVPAAYTEGVADFEKLMAEAPDF